MSIAILTVIGMIALVMNWRVGIIVATAVPITYALTLLANWLMGYTINRVTLFALILALGLLVDDPIVGVENIYRHLGLRRLQISFQARHSFPVAQFGFVSDRARRGFLPTARRRFFLRRPRRQRLGDLFPPPIALGHVRLVGRQAAGGFH